MECSHTLGGIEVETLLSHDFSKPFIDIRYCSDCHAYYRIIIKSTHDIPEITMFEREDKLPWIDFNIMFPLIKINGRRITRK
jgi:hypothetical protein